MSFVDRRLVCADCGAPFLYTARERERDAWLGLTQEPRRCGPCRMAGRSFRAYGVAENRPPAVRPIGFSHRSPAVFPATCVDCGKDTRLPFRPRGDRPVYCSDCYGLRR